MSNKFIEYLNIVVPLTQDCEQAIMNITLHRTLPKNTLIQKNGKVCTEFHFIEKGLARVFYHKNEKQVVVWFACENQLVSAIDSLFTGLPSDYNIELLEESIVWSIQFDRIEPVFKQFPEVERLGRLLITNNYLILERRMRTYTFNSPEARYKLLTRLIPNIVNRTNLGYIASYMGVTQEHLSRLRSASKL